MIRAAACGTAAAAVLLTAACGATAPPRPVGAAAVDPTALEALERATLHCRPLRTATMALRLSGRAGAERISARLVAGFAEPASMRLEALAPFGPPALLLASDGRTDTLFFPRDRQVVRDATVAEVLDALTGLAMDAADLRRTLLGCLVPTDGTGARFGDGWQTVADQHTRVYLRRGLIVATDYRGWQVDYAAPEGGIARHVRVRRMAGGPTVDLAAVMSELEINIDIVPAAFVLDVPIDASLLTLDDLRRTSPLRAP